MKKAIVVLVVLVLLVWAFAGEDTSDDVMTVDEHTHMQVSTDGTYNISTASSTIEWIGRKTFVDGYEDSGVILFKSGEFAVTDGMLTAASFVVDMQSIKAVKTGTGNGQAGLEKHLKSDDFFGVETYPEATFVVTNSDDAILPARTADDQSSEWDGMTYDITGELTIKGITHPAVAKVALFEEDGVVQGTAQMNIDRSKYDVRFGSGSFFDDLGDKAIDDIFTLNIMFVTGEGMSDSDIEAADEMTEE